MGSLFEALAGEVPSRHIYLLDIETGAKRRIHDMRIVRVRAETGAREPWMEIVPRVRSGVHGVNSVRLSLDGERYVYSYVSILGALCHVKGLA